MSCFCKLRFLAIMLVWPIALPLLAAELPSEPRPRDRQITVLVTTLLESQHLSKHPLDDEIAKRTLAQFLKRLDPRKLYFNQSDVDQFLKLESQLNDRLSDHDLTIAYTIFHRFRERVGERAETIEKLLTGKFDFTLKETINQDTSLNQFAENQQQAENRWRHQIKYDLLTLDPRDPQAMATREQVGQRYRQFSQQITNTTADDLLEMFLSSLTSSFDPHTSYLSPPSYESFQIRMRLNYQGIGAELEQHTGYVAIRKLLPGGDAQKQGKLQAKDRIVSVGQGADAEMIDVTGKTLREIVQLIRGPEGTLVRLGVLPADGSKLTIHQLTRHKVTLQDSAASSAVKEGPAKADGTPTRIGVINLPSFYVDLDGLRNNRPNYKSSSRDVRSILENFQKQQVDLVLVDLRKNGGGSLVEAINLTGLFINQGPVVQVKDSHQRVQLLLDKEVGVAWSGPLVVLTSHMSASASEIFAGAIQDYRRGLLVGDPATHGKGTVQQIMDLNRQLFRTPANSVNLGALKLTVQQFYRPNGETTQLRGVLPDLVLPSIVEAAGHGESKLSFSLPFDKVEAVSFTPYLFTDPELITKLSQQSSQRQEESAAMQALKKKLQRFRLNQQAKTIPLNQQQYVASFADTDLSPSVTRPAAEEEAKGSKPTGPYLTEVLAIASDYFRLLDEAKITIDGKPTE